MIFQLLPFEGVEPPPIDGMSRVGENTFLVNLTDNDRFKKHDGVLDIIDASEDFFISDAFRAVLKISWDNILKHEDPRGHSLLGTTQLMTWLNGYFKDGLYGSNIENKQAQVGIYKDAAALAPLNLTPYRIWDIAHGYGVSKSNRSLFYVVNKAVMLDETDGLDLVKSERMSYSVQMAALASLGGVVTETSHWKMHWNKFDPDAPIGAFPEGCFISGRHPDIGNWALIVSSIPLSSSQLVDVNYVGRFLGSVVDDGINFAGGVLSDTAAKFENTFSTLGSFMSESESVDEE